MKPLSFLPAFLPAIQARVSVAVPRLEKRRVLLALAIVPGAVIAAPSFALERSVRLVPSVGAHGPIVEAQEVVEPDATSPPAEARLDSRAMQLLWSRHVPDPIYTTTGISMPTETVLAGNWLNAPRQTEALSLFGSGTPVWTHLGTEFYVDAARGADVLAALDCTPNDSTVTVMEWRAGSSTPLWTFRLHPCRQLTGEGWSSGKGIQVSDDGSTIAAVVNTYGAGGQDVRLLVFDSGSGTPAVDHQFPDGSATALSITPDGAYIAIYAWPFIYVYDRYAEAIRWSGSAGSGNDALAISPDGNYIAWGWNVLNLRQWNGSIYQSLWTTSKTGFYVTECAFSADQSLAVAWYRSTFDDAIVELFTLPAHTLIWDYSYAQDPLALRRVAAGASVGAAPPGDSPSALLLSTDVISEMVFSPDGSHLAAASWGPQFSELHVWAASSETPVAILDTPGTMFDVDVVSSGPDAAYATACGKHVHAGTSGRGADLYALGVRAVGVEEIASARAEPRLTLYPNPAAGSVTIDWSALRERPTRLSIHDVQGRLVADLGALLARGGAASVVWNGRDLAGRPAAPGVYLLRSDGAMRGAARLVIVK